MKAEYQSDIQCWYFLEPCAEARALECLLPTLIVSVAGHHPKAGIDPGTHDAWGLVGGGTAAEKEQRRPDGQQQEAEEQGALYHTAHSKHTTLVTSSLV